MYESLTWIRLKWTLKIRGENFQCFLIIIWGLVSTSNYKCCNNINKKILQIKWMLPFSHFRIVLDSSSCNSTSEENTKNHIDRMEDTHKLNAIMNLDKDKFFILINASEALLRLWHKSFFVKILYRVSDYVDLMLIFWCLILQF